MQSVYVIQLQNKNRAKRSDYITTTRSLGKEIEMKIFTIGFTKTSAKEFFEKLKNSRVKKILDVRLNNRSQLAGFAKANDLKYFAQTICSAGYEHLKNLAPTDEIFKAYQPHAKHKKNEIKHGKNMKLSF